MIFQSLTAELLDLAGDPPAIAAQIALIPCIVDFLFPHMNDRRRLDKGPHIQRSPTCLGQRDSTEHGWGLMQGLIGDQQQALILTHHTPRLETGPLAPARSKTALIAPCPRLIYIKHEQMNACCHDSLIQIRFKRRQRRKKE